MKDNLFVLLATIWILAVALPSSRAPARSAKYTLYVHAVPCGRDIGVPIAVAISQSIAPPRLRRPMLVEKRSFEDGVWLIRASAPIAHRYIWLTTPHCSAHVVSVAVRSGVVRQYAVALGPGLSTGFEEGDRYVMGTLPFAGTAAVDLVAMTDA